VTPEEKQALAAQDLIIDRVYRGGRSGNASDDPLPPLVGVSNQGGFRTLGEKAQPRLVVLTSTMADPDWPDGLDTENGLFTYFGDNKKPGHELHDTPRFGNLLLRDMFDRARGSADDRSRVPPVLVFANKKKTWRDVEFIGLLVPGAQNLDSNQDLVAVWKQKDGKRFQNYQAKFTVLAESRLSREWLTDIQAGNPLSAACPPSWRRWVETGGYTPLKAPRTIEHRTRAEQLPQDQLGNALIARLHEHFAAEPVQFEACAAKIAELMLKDIVVIDLTRPSRDGGRDAVGQFRIGYGSSAVLVDFALEAKCYDAENSVGVKELSRLISRLRHRQFGVLVTTSYVAAQAYQEIKEDQHPIVIITAVDIVHVLRTTGINSVETLREWLQQFES
jgi:hypothetical protein